jgi:thioredoxin reductase
MEIPIYDVVVVGGGAAGLSAALVLGRARRRVLVIDAGAPRNAPAAHMHGFLSQDGLAPGELLAVGREEVQRYGGVLVSGAVAGVVNDGAAGFSVVLRAGPSVFAPRLLVATGLRDEIPDIPGLRERWARDVLHCPYCHGFEVRDRKLGVLGGSPAAVRYAQIVRQWSDDVVYIAPIGTLTAAERDQLTARGIGIVEGAAQQVLVDGDHLCGVELDGDRTVPCEALFVPPRFVPNNDLLVDLGCELDEDGWPITDGIGLTSVAGVWVAGNVANPRAQVITAAGEGSAAAIAINADLVEEDVCNAVRTFAGISTSEPDKRTQPATEGIPMTDRTPGPVPPPNKHQLSLMIWLCVFPTLTVINLALGDWLKTFSPVLRTFVLATITVPRARGAELVGELERYKDSYRLCCVRGPEGIIVELAEQIG